MEGKPIKKLLTTYLRRLTNLSGNNRSLFLPRPSADQFIDLHSLSQLNNEKSFSIIEALIANKKKLICSALDARLALINEASKKLKRLQRIDNFLFEERGSRDLHVGWPFVKGKFLDGTCVRCPLLFFPVEVSIQNNNWIIKQRPDAEITFNKSFLLAYAFYNNVKLNETLLEENFDSVDRDSTVFRTALYRLLQEASFEINFNADNFRDELTSFTHYKRNEFDEQFRNGELKLFPEALLGIFPQASSYLVPDYHALLDLEEMNDLEDFFAKRSPEQKVLGSLKFIDQVKEEKVYPAFAMDVWQENALKAVKLGNSIVVQGPPGTGKSHLICNLICDAVANRLRVLVVCQKRAALDVVYNRLKEIKLEPFLALVHDFKEDRKRIYDKIAEQIDRVEDYKKKNNSLDAIQLERRFYALSRRIDQITAELEEFRHALFETSTAGISAKQLYLQSSFRKPYINLKQEFSFHTVDAQEVFLRHLKAYCHYAKIFLDESYEWNDRKSFSRLTEGDYEQVRQYLFEISEHINSIESSLREILNTEIEWHEIFAFADYRTQIDEVSELIDSEKHFTLFKNIVHESEEETNALWLSNIERLVVACYEQEGPETSIETANLGHFQLVLQKYMNARRSIIGLIKWKLFAKEKTLVTRALIANQLKNDKAGLKLLEKKLDRRLNLEHNFSKIRTKDWLSSFPKSYSLSELVHWFQLQQRIIHAKTIFVSIRGILNFIDPSFISFHEFTNRINSLFGTASKLELKKTIWSTYFTENQIRLFADKATIDHYEKVLRRDFSGLIEFDSQREKLLQKDITVIEKLVAKEKQWNFDKLKELYLNSISLAWIEHLETKFPILTLASSGKMDLLEDELQEAIEEKLKISNEILLLRARENVVDDLEFNRLNNRVTYRDLLHQVSKKKKIWPIRKLIQQHESELFQLMPCWLASPETVSAIFPMQEMFDLVIFDEASQCFVERGIPAMYRGKQVVIAGDDQQLRPSDLYQTRWQEEGVDNPDLEIDSLLDVSKRYLLQTDLRHHYRSESLDLIEFSNHNFYKGKLQLLPNREAANNPIPAIDYQKVNGNWHEQTNQVEANKVVSLIISLTTENPHQSIGVITFNAPQQNLIQDTLEAKLKEVAISVDSLFIKNIENVQGDERDVIIFSIGYAPDDRGKMSMQFGSLNQHGGENRLNVAVTRAKKKIIIVTSIFPDQLHVEATVNQGPKLLKAYLSYAWQVSQGLRYQPAGNDNLLGKYSLNQIIKDWANQYYPSRVSRVNAIPAADITIEQDKKFEGLIFTDDEPYKINLSAKERHALLPAAVEQKNWRMVALYSRNYWQDHERFFNEVARFIENP